MSTDDLKAWLEANGFRTATERFRAYTAGWYAYRHSKIPARECETNDGKPAQIVVYPYPFDGPGSVEVELCGETNGIWWKLQAYSVRLDELPLQLEGIEASLVAAWNALVPATSERVRG